VIRRLVAALAVTAVALASVACTSSSGEHRTVAPSSSSDQVSSSAPATSLAPSSATTDPAAREAADRHAVEVAWSHYWSVYETFDSTYPESRWNSVIVAIAVDPIRTQILKAARADRIVGVVGYGYVIAHPFWQAPIAGRNTATMGDCQDASHAGSMFAKTRQKRTVGVAHNNIRATVVRGSDDVWRVKQIKYLLDQKCG
jgi:hypothetical protein